MKKELPKIFINKIDKKLNNNKQVSYSYKEKNKQAFYENGKENKKTISININEKIDNILNSPRYVYKADVLIDINNKIIKRQIVGKNNTHIITINNELIPINEIKDISFSK